jgi:hypothetical protein
MTLRPEEFHGLTKAEAAEMKALNLNRDQYERHRICVAHGSLCASLIHLRQAQRFFKQHTPELAAKLGNIGAQLDECVPDYATFSASVTKGIRR